MTDTTKFMWASIVSGKKQTFADVDAKAREVTREEAAVQREKGYWKKVTYKRLHDDHDDHANKLLKIPANVNERAVHFIESFLATFPEEAQKCTTIGDLQLLFQNTYVPYVRVQYPRQATDSMTDYSTIQKWVAAEEQQYTADKAKGMLFPPPWLNSLWVFAKNVTFENCLWALSYLSKTFLMDQLDEKGIPYTGYLRILGDPKKADSFIIWLDNLSTYQPYRHERKIKYKQRS
jgi:hypothetical protein